MKKLLGAFIAIFFLDNTVLAESTETTVEQAAAGESMGSAFFAIAYIIAIVALIYVVLVVMNRVFSKKHPESEKNTESEVSEKKNTDEDESVKP